MTLFSAHGEVLLYGKLYTAARPVRIEKGIFEFSVDQELAKNALTKISSKLKEWTGEAWLVTVSKKQGNMTLVEEDEKAKQDEIDRIKQDPIVAEIFNHFPNAYIKNVV